MVRVARAREATIAAIDVGTNSVHMVIAEVDARGFRILTSEKEVVRLGEGAGGMDHLTDAAIDRGVGALARMKQIADVHGATVRAVATSAVREADNQRDFIRRVRRNVGIPVEVISGPEEARLIHLGVSHSLNLRTDSVVTVDIGGGSTEFCVAKNGKLRIAQSLKLGAVRMTDEYLPGGVVTPHGIDRLRRKVRTSLAPLAHDIRAAGFDRVVLSSGTTETVSRIVANLRGGAVPQSLNGFSFDRAELDHAVEILLAAESPSARETIAGVEPKRADIIAAGAVILQEIAALLRARRFEFSEAALREGVLIDTARRSGILEPDGIDSGLESAARLAERCSVDMEHSSHVADLAVEILRGLGRSFDLDMELERQLRAAALLAKTGNAIAYSRHHMHSYYIILNADLTGFTHDEIENIALVARYHRKSTPKMSHEEFARLPEERRHDVELMSAVLRVATGLDRTHDQCVRSVSVSNRQSVITILARHSCEGEENIDLNVSTAQSRAEMLEEFLGEPVLVRDGGPAQ